MIQLKFMKITIDLLNFANSKMYWQMQELKDVHLRYNHEKSRFDNMEITH